MSERILSFAYLMCPSVSGPKALKNVSPICHIQFQWKVTEHFRNRIEKYGVVVEKSLSLKEYFERKSSKASLCCLCVNLPTVKIWGQSDKFPMSFSFLQCPRQVKNWIEKTALNMSIRRVIFTSGQNLKPPFFFQYLIFSNDFLFYIYFNQKNRNLKKIVDLKVYCNLKWSYVSTEEVLYCSLVL